MKQKYSVRNCRAYLLATAFVILLSLKGYSQSSAQISSDELKDFLHILSTRAKNVKTMSASFKQYKKMEMMKGEMLSEGKFIYSDGDKMAFLYEKPGKYSMIINGSKFKMSTASGSSKMDLSSNPVMKQMNELIQAVFTGTIDQAFSNYDITFNYNDGGISALVKPKSSRMASMIKSIYVLFDKATGEIKEITVLEGSAGTTRYLFFDQKTNVIIDNEIFAIN